MAQSLLELHDNIQQCFPYLDKKLKQSPPKIQILDNSQQNLEELKRLERRIAELEKLLKLKEDEVLHLSARLLKLQKLISFSKTQQDIIIKENKNLSFMLKEMKLKLIKDTTNDEDLQFDLITQNNNVYNYLNEYKGKHPFFDSLLIKNQKSRRLSIQQFIKCVDQQLNYHQNGNKSKSKNRYSLQRPLQLHSKYFTSPKQLSPINMSNNNLTTEGEDNLKYRSYSFQSH